MSYQALMTVAYFEIVKELPKDSYGLIFGFNTFVALGIQVLLCQKPCQKHSSINPTYDEITSSVNVVYIKLFFDIQNKQFDVRKMH